MDLPEDTTGSDMEVEDKEEGQLSDEGNIAPTRNLSPTRYPVIESYDFEADDSEFGPTTEAKMVATVRQSSNRKTSPDLTTQWCVDSGSGRSMCTSREWLTWTETIDNGHQLLSQSFSYDDLVKELRRQHLRLGHCHATVLAKFVSSGRIKSLPSMNEKTILTILEKSLECQMCIRHKTMRIPYKNKVGSRPIMRCHTLHSDTKGPYPIKGCFNGTNGMIHLLVVSDDATSYKWVYFLKRLSDAPIRLI